MTEAATLQNILDIAKTICGENKSALLWFDQWGAATQVWDNCVDDGDTPDAKQADYVFNAILTEWPLNTWFLKHRASLVPVMVNAISAWRASDLDTRQRPRAYDACSEVLCTIAFIEGGQGLVNEWSPEIRKLCLELQEANDKGDK